MNRSIAMLFLVAIVSTPSCGGAGVTEKAARSITTALEATNAARDQFVKWDEQHQLAIVDRASTREGAEAELAAYREKRQKVTRAFAVAYSAIASAAAIVPLIELGEKPTSDLVKLLGEAASAVQTALAVYEEMQQALGESPPKEPPPIPPPPPNPQPPPAAEPTPSPD
jgi:hypothetical protein